MVSTKSFSCYVHTTLQLGLQNTEISVTVTERIIGCKLKKYYKGEMLNSKDPKRVFCGNSLVRMSIYFSQM